WEAALPQKEKDMSSERQYSTAYYRTSSGDVDDLGTGGDESEELTERIEWISFKQHFFSSVLIAGQGFSGGKLDVKTVADDRIVKSFAANMALDFNRQDVNTYAMTFFFGP